MFIHTRFLSVVFALNTFMKVVFTKDRTITGIQKAIAIMPPKSGAAALRSLWIRAENNAMTVYATDASLEFTGTYPAEVSEPGFIGVQGQIFYGLVSTCTGSIGLKYNEGEGSVELEHKTGVCKLPVMTLTWFQDVKPYPQTEGIDWSGDMLKEILDKVTFCINDESSTAAIDALCCLYITKNENKIDFCGLNGHLFGQFSIIHDQLKSQLPDGGILIQKSNLSILNKWLNNDEIEIKITDTSVFFKNKNEEILAIPRVLDAVYPNYMNFLNRFEQGHSTLTVNKDDLMRALDRISMVNTATDSTTDLYISEDNKNIDCSANIENTGEVLEKIDITYDGSIRKISFRTKNLINVLDHFSSKTISIKLTTEIGPCCFQGDEDPFYQAVLMPVQTIEKTYTEEN